MPNPATVREQRLRKTKAQLIDEIDTLEQRVGAIKATYRSGAPMRAKASDRYLANQELADLARFPSENPSPVLKAMPDGTVLYANDAAIAVNELLKGRKKSMLADDLVEVCAEASHSAEVRETEFKSADRVFAFSIIPVADETYINIYGRDITERKQTEQALLESEKRFRDLFETAAHGVNLTALDGRFSAVNNALCEMLGYSEKELLATDFQTITHPEDIDRDLADWQSLLAGETRSYQMEKRYFHKQGNLIDVLLSVSLIRDSNGEPLYAVGHVHDITERKRTEEQLAEKEAQLRLVFDNMPGAIVYTDKELNIVVCNDRFADSYQAPRELLQPGRPYPQFLRYLAEHGYYGEGDPDAFVAARVESLRNPSDKTSETRTPDGYIYEIHRRRAATGGTVTVMSDITERKRAEEALRKSEQRLKDSIEALADGFALHDADDSLVLYNRRYAELLSPAITDALKPGTQWEANLRAQCAQGLIPAADGRLEAWIAERRSAHLNPKGPIVQERSGNAWIRLNERKAQDDSIVTIVTDITELKRTEQALREKSDFLRLNQVITQAANEATSVDEAVQKLLDQVCAHTGWPVGHAYMLDEAAEDLVSSGIWHLDDTQQFETFRRVTEATRFVSGVGLPGRVLASRQPAWIVDVTMDPNFPRAKLAKEIGVRAGAAFPVLVGPRVVAVLEFFSAEAVEAYEPLLEVMAQIGTQLGRAIERQRAEQGLRESQKQLQALADNLQVALSSMSDGISILDSDLNIVTFNQRYVDLLNFPEGLVREGRSIVDVAEFAAKRGDYGSQFDGDIDEVVAARLKQLKSNEENLIENITPTGRIVEYRSSPIKGGGGGCVMIMHDITERRQAEEALEKAHEIIKGQKERMEKELNVAHEIQMSMVPLTFPPYPARKEFSIYATLEPALEVGGDFYDFFLIDEDRLCFCVGDVSGKGVPSALFMAVTRTMIKSKASHDPSTASILTFVNGQISQDNPSCMFVTLWVGVLDIGTGEVTYTNAGHNPPYLKRVDGSLEKLDKRHGPVVGAVEGLVYGEDKLKFGSEDLLLAFTDGVTEEIDVNYELYGEMRLEALLSEMTDVSVEQSVQDVVASVREFQGESAQDDDITVLALQFHA